jgi:hypothetical protein
MPTRHSSYDIIEGETYVTPHWVFEDLRVRFVSFYGAPDPFPANSSANAMTKPFPKCFATNPPFSMSDEIVAKALHEGCTFALLLRLA